MKIDYDPKADAMDIRLAAGQVGPIATTSGPAWCSMPAHQ